MTIGRLYEFVYRGILTDEALDRAGRKSGPAELTAQEVAEALSVDLLDPDVLVATARMAAVYAAIAAFEISARRFITKVLLEAHGEDWWNQGVSEKIRTFAASRRDDEEKTRWHGRRGTELLDYVEMGHLVNIIQQNWGAFEDYIPRVDWATAIFGGIERSRNVIMHSGFLDMEDIERVGMHVRDWAKQVGS
jgi:hypothetical protein